jgi:sugar lactone lactonase YvrE
MMTKFEIARDANVVLAETPIWDSRLGALLWTDMFEGDIYEWCPASGKEKKWTTKKESGAKRLIGSAVPTDDETKLFVAVEDGFFVLDKTTGAMKLIANPAGDDKLFYNDTRIDARGRIVGSSLYKSYITPAYNPKDTGALYVVEKCCCGIGGVSAKKIAGDVKQFNCVVWTPDGKKMYVADTWAKRLLAWDYDADVGPVGECRVALEFAGKQETPDGMCFDAEGNLYICHWSGTISVWDKNLNLKENIPFPVEQVCACGFGGQDMRDFYVTTARFGYTEEQMKNRNGAGGIFVARSEIEGVPEHFYRI